MSKEERIRFLLDHRAGRVLVKVAQVFAPFIGFAVSLFFAWNIETRLFPVITGWTINPIQVVDGHFVLSGTIRKDRACDLVATSVVAVPKAKDLPRQLIFQIKPGDILGGNVPTGLSTWGPWVVKVPKQLADNRGAIDHLEVVGQHHCHALWHQETVYGRIPMDQVPS